MDVADLLLEAYGRIKGVVHHVVDDLDEEQLAARPGPHANTIAWLVWHLARVQDDHVAEVAGREQVYAAGGFAERFALPFDAAATGYGHSPEEAGHVRAPAQLLVSYYDAVHEATVAYLASLGPQDLDRVVDEGWDPPVTLGVRLVSVLDDDLQHAGQAGYARGLLGR